MKKLSQSLVIASALVLSAASVFAGPVTEAKQETAATKTATPAPKSDNIVIAGDKTAEKSDATTTPAKPAHKHVAHHGKKAAAVATKTPATTTAPATAQ